MKHWLARRSGRVILATAAIGLIAGGVAYATIPDGHGVFTGCLLKETGTIRLIDTSLGNSNLLGHCTRLETQRANRNCETKRIANRTTRLPPGPRPAIPGVVFYG